jgi:hypothetical protein
MKELQVIEKPAKILKGDILTVDFTSDKFIASGGGFGTNPETIGTAIYGAWADGSGDDRVERYEVTKIEREV